MFGIISKFITQTIANGIGILAIAYLVNGAFFNGGWLELLEIAIVLAILNIIVRPILKLIFGPLIIITFGIFSLVLNGAILWAATFLFPQYLIIPFWWPLIWATLIISVINIIFGVARKRD